MKLRLNEQFECQSITIVSEIKSNVSRPVTVHRKGWSHQISHDLFGHPFCAFFAPASPRENIFFLRTFCRFYFRFWLPFLVAVWQSQIIY
ncbi:MAG: hypothetical protein ACLQBD_12330 [Syntrophobacteraceae bacterium]